MTGKRVCVVGATGYSGGELTALLSRHPSATVAALFSSAGGKRVSFSSLHPSLGASSGPDALPFDLDGLLASAPDAVFLATPNETSAELAPALVDAGVAVIDVSGAFRLKDAAAYPAWYGFEHPRPELLERAEYGLVEVDMKGPLARPGGGRGAPRSPLGASSNGESADSSVGAGERLVPLVANPGCYPTSVLLALKPIAALVDWTKPVIVNSASGVSGAGKKSEIAYSFAELSGNFKAYGVGAHRHEPEMRQELGLSAEAPFTFVPHLLPAVRGILSTIHVVFQEPVTREALLSRYDAAYGDRAFVKVRSNGALPELRDVVGTPRCEIGFALLSGGARAVVVSALDNLLKGAASQAVQNFNRIFGFDDAEGLA